MDISPIVIKNKFYYCNYILKSSLSHSLVKQVNFLLTLSSNPKSLIYRIGNLSNTNLHKKHKTFNQVWINRTNQPFMLIRTQKTAKRKYRMDKHYIPGKLTLLYFFAFSSTIFMLTNQWFSVPFILDTKNINK